MRKVKKSIVTWVIVLTAFLGGGTAFAVNHFTKAITPTEITDQKSAVLLNTPQDAKAIDSGTEPTPVTADTFTLSKRNTKALLTGASANTVVSSMVSSDPQKSAKVNTIPVLYYHSILNEPGNELRMPPEQFEEQMKYLSDHGYHVLTIDQLYNVLYENGTAPEKPVVITFDDGYSDNFTQAFPIMQKYHFSGTVFMVSSFVNGQGFLTEDQLKQLQAAGWAIGGHTKNHTNLTTVSINATVKELKDSRTFLEHLLGQPLKYFAYPYGGYRADIKEAVKEDGYLLAFTTERGWTKRNSDPLLIQRVYCYANMGIKEYERRLSNPNY